MTRINSKCTMFTELCQYCSLNEANESPQILPCQKGLCGEEIFFEPFPGFYFCICKNAKVMDTINVPFCVDSSVFTAHLLLDGACDYVISTASTDTIHFQKNMYMLGYWNNVNLQICCPVQKAYTYINFYVQEKFITSHLGNISLKFLKEKISSLSAKNTIKNTYTGLLTPNILAQALQIMSFKKDENHLVLRSNILNFFVNLFSEPNHKQEDSAYCIYEYDKVRAHEIKKYIEDNFLTILSVKDICVKHAVSVSKADKLFKSIYSVTIAQYIHQCKMNHAYTLLSELKCNVSECAHEIGYSNISHFITAFKKHYTITPKSVSLSNSKKIMHAKNK